MITRVVFTSDIPCLRHYLLVAFAEEKWADFGFGKLNITLLGNLTPQVDLPAPRRSDMTGK